MNLSAFKMKRSKLWFLIFLVFSVGILSSYVRGFKIEGPSMSPTVLSGDTVYVNMASYDLRLPHLKFVIAQTGNPQRGDLVIYEDPRGYYGLKRIIGLPGDEIRLVNNRIYIDGTPVEQFPRPNEGIDAELSDIDLGDPPVELGEVFAEEKIGVESYIVTFTEGRSDKATYGPVIVPLNSYFILGDHRDNSGDSRFEFQGFVSRKQILGRMFLGKRKY